MSQTDLIRIIHQAFGGQVTPKQLEEFFKSRGMSYQGAHDLFFSRMKKNGCLLYNYVNKNNTVYNLNYDDYQVKFVLENYITK